jgi:hypothetical protein
MWEGPIPLIGDINFMTQSLAEVTLWLDAIETDTSETFLAQKILINKPTEIGVGAHQHGNRRLPSWTIRSTGRHGLWRLATC